MLLLGVPALLCIFAVVPVTIYWMNTYFFEGGSNNEPHSGWMGHSWFLFVLIFYNIFLGTLSYFLDFSVMSLAKILGVIGSQVLLIILLILISMLAVKIIQKFGSSLPYNNHWRWLATATFQNLPYFMLGMMMYKWQNVYKLLHSKPILWVFTAVTLVVIKWQLGLYEITSTTQHLTFMLITFGTAITVSAALFSLTSQLINRKNQAINIFSESAYTVYILHYIIIIAVVLVQLQRLNVTMPVRMLVACFVAAVGGVCVHLFIVKKFWPAEFLLNGKLRIKK